MSTRVHHKAHKRIKHGYLFSASKSFEEGKHNPTWLASKLVHFTTFRSKGLSEKQRKALHAYNEFVTSHAGKSSTTNQILNAYFPFFDNLFFFGSLTGRVRWVRDERSADEAKMFGQLMQELDSNGERPQTGKKFVIILYDLEDYQKEHSLDWSETLAFYISTLLHEMIHGFFRLWACEHVDCKEDWHKTGKMGHGCAWQDVAVAIETAAKDDSLLGLELDLGREEALAEELLGTGMKTGDVSDRDLERWCFKRSGVRKAVEGLMERVGDGEWRHCSTRRIIGPRPKALVR